MRCTRLSTVVLVSTLLTAGGWVEAQEAEADASRDVRQWHAGFVELLRPVLAARERLYRRMPYRMFPAVRRYCASFALAVEDALPVYRPAPERQLDGLARELLAVYRESARYCVEGSYFSFTVRESQVRSLVHYLIVALRRHELEFPRPAPGPDQLTPSRGCATKAGQ